MTKQPDPQTTKNTWPKRKTKAFSIKVPGKAMKLRKPQIYLVYMSPAEFKKAEKLGMKFRNVMVQYG